ncbi:MAG: hypothetical protein CME55_08295 [Halieaceae bacterium]|nr:hypothetical protein [Halieaceae bacterium]
MSGSIRRAFLADLTPGQRVLDTETSKYLITVLRLSKNDEVSFFNGQGSRAHARILEPHRTKTTVHIEASTFSDPTPPTLHLCCALPKGDRAEWIIEKCSELGVSSIRWISCDRSQNPKKDHTKRLERWTKIAREAARQSHNDWVPTLHATTSLQETCDIHSNHTRIVLDTSNAPSAVNQSTDLSKAYAMLVGPEGGFTETERELLRTAGWRPMSLGASILRVETAAIVGVGFIRAITNETSKAC